MADKKHRENRLPVADIEIIRPVDGRRTAKSLAQNIQQVLLRIDSGLRAQPLGAEEIHIYSETHIASDRDEINHAIRAECDKYAARGKYIGSYGVKFIDVQPQRDAVQIVEFYRIIEGIKSIEAETDKAYIEADDKLKLISQREGELDKREKALSQRGIKDENYVAVSAENDRLKEQVSRLQETHTDKGLRRQLEVAQTEVRDITQERDKYKSQLADKGKALEDMASGGVSQVEKFNQRRVTQLESLVTRLREEVERGKKGVYKNSYEACLPILADVSKRIPSLIEYLQEMERGDETAERLTERISELTLMRILEKDINPETLVGLKEQFGVSEADLRIRLFDFYAQSNPDANKKYVEAVKDVESSNKNIAGISALSIPDDVKDKLLREVRAHYASTEKVIRDYESLRDVVVNKETENIKECFELLDNIRQSDGVKNPAKLEEILGGRDSIPLLVRTSRGEDAYEIRLVLPMDVVSLDKSTQGPLAEEDSVSTSIRELHNRVASAALFNKPEEIFDPADTFTSDDIEVSGLKLVSYKLSIPLTEDPQKVTQKSRNIADSVIARTAELKLRDYGVSIEVTPIYQHFPINGGDKVEVVAINGDVELIERQVKDLFHSRMLHAVDTQGRITAHESSKIFREICTDDIMERLDRTDIRGFQRKLRESLEEDGKMRAVSGEKGGTIYTIGK